MAKAEMELNSIFNMDAEELKETEQSYESEVFKPSLDKEKRDTYEAVLKFIPWHKDWKKSKISKWCVWLVNEDTGSGKLIDCPSTIKEKSILQDVYFTLKNSPNADEVALAPIFSRKKMNFSLVQIIKDKQHPELEGKIKIFQYGKTIGDKIEQILNPKNDLISKNNPFDVFDGKLFLFHLKKVGGYANYDDCQFLDKVMPITIDETPVKKDPKNFPKIVKFLEENSPDLEKYDFRPWDDDTKEFVNETIKSTLAGTRIIDKIFKRNHIDDEPQVPKAQTTQKRQSQTEVTKITKDMNKGFEDIVMPEAAVEESDEVEEPDEIDNFLSTIASSSKSKLNKDDDGFFG